MLANFNAHLTVSYRTVHIRRRVFFKVKEPLLEQIADLATTYENFIMCHSNRNKNIYCRF
jgi:hypothetical protein